MTMDSATRSDEADEAINWIARLRAHDVSDIDRVRFTEWIADDRHRREFDALLDLWEQLSCVTGLDPRH